MLSLPGTALQRVRAFGRGFFHQFGIHCATHQIRVILISAIVITSLLFPAITLYSSSHTHFFAITLRVLDSFLTPDEFSTYFAQDDIRYLWEGYDTLHVREDSLARARCGSDAIFRAERVLVHRVSKDEDFSPVNHRTLISTLALERRISEVLSSRGIPCLTARGGECFVLSPLAFWNHDDSALSSDQNLADTLTLSKNVSSFGITITPEMVLAGREDVSGSARSVVDSATFLALTYFFTDTDCSNNAGHFAWLHALEEATESVGDLITQAQVPRLVALEYDKTSKHPSILSVFSYVAYLAFLVYFYYTMRRMDTVHSRIGLAFTGIVEILVSTVTSLSVCALAGFRITMIPWEIFPIVVIFIGVENMFSIVDAVVKTSVALPVKLRMAEGLSRAGTSNTLKLVSYNTVLGLIAAFSSGAIRQFSAFAIVVLVAHWFLVHTFFVTVLSIDIQRLELDELLRQNSSLAPTVPASLKSPAKSPKTLSARLLSHAQSLLRGRAAKNISLLLLLAITATLYYATYPGPTRLKEDNHPPLLRNAKNRSSKTPIQEGISPALHVWQLLNPTNDEMVHIRVETPTILLMGNISGGTQDTRHLGGDHDRISRSRCPWLSRLWIRTMRPLAWFIKIVVMPITVTIVLLYGLLRYLLKDADLLEAQRNRAEPDSPAKEEVPPPVEGKIVFTTLPRAFATDVDLVAANKAGTVVVAIGLQNELVMWRADTQSFIPIDTSDLLLGSSASTPTPAATLTAVSVDDRGTFCAVGTGSGVIAVWSLLKNSVNPLPHLALDNTISAVTHIQFAPNPAAETGRSTPMRSRTSPHAEMTSEVLGSLYATYENGAAIKWTVTSFAVPTYITPSKSASVVKSILLPVQADGRLLICFSLDDGSIELCDLENPDGLLPNECYITAGNPSDLVTKVYVCRVELEGVSHLVVGAATQAGVVSLWDARTAECMHIVDELFGEVNCLRVTPVTTKVCPHCGELPFENFSLSFSVGQIVVFYRIYLSVPTRRCSCVQNQPPQTMRSNLLGRRSRSGSSTSASGTITPTNSRSRLPSFSSVTSAFETNMFPVSGHGVHSRRASEKDTLRRNLDPFMGSDMDDMEIHVPIGPPDFNSSSGLLHADHRTSLWQNLVVVRNGDARFERGGWDAADDGKIVGIRRKQRLTGVPNGKSNAATTTPKVLLPQEASTSVGLTNSTLERWELWTYCPSTSSLHASPLAMLQNGPPAFHRTHSASSSSSSTSSSSSSLSSSPARKDVRILSPSSSPQSNYRILANTKQRVSGDTIPRLHFTRVSPFIGNRSFCVAGFGNTVGIFTLASSHSRPKQPSIESLRDVSNQFF